MARKVFLSLFAILLVSLSLLTFLLPKAEFSDNENRTLAVFPKISAQTIFDGSFMENFSTYLADHFAFRDFWVSVKTSAEKALLKTENNGVYSGDDGYLIDSFDNTSLLHFDENLEAVRTFETMLKQNYNITLYTLIAPTATEILQDKLPRFAPTVDFAALHEQIDTSLAGNIPLSETLMQHKDEYLYYRTDHHWTSLGAYYAYMAYKQAQNETAYAYDEADMEVVTDSFFGTTYSRYGLFDGKHADSISAPSAAFCGAMTVEKDRETTNSIYSPEMLEMKDKYLYFLGGNDSRVTITTEVKNGKTLLLVKDSYANAFLPYLTQDYETIIVLDMRYYKGIVPNLITEEQVTDVLLLYNLKSFAEDEYIPFINFAE